MYDSLAQASAHQGFASDSELDFGIEWGTSFQYEDGNVIMDLGLVGSPLLVHRDVLCAESEYFRELLTNDSVSLVRAPHGPEMRTFWLTALRSDKHDMAILTHHHSKVQHGQDPFFDSEAKPYDDVVCGDHVVRIHRFDKGMYMGPYTRFDIAMRPDDGPRLHDRRRHTNREELVDSYKTLHLGFLAIVVYGQHVSFFETTPMPCICTYLIDLFFLARKYKMEEQGRAAIRDLLLHQDGLWEDVGDAPRVYLWFAYHLQCADLLSDAFKHMAGSNYFSPQILSEFDVPDNLFEDAQEAHNQLAGHVLGLCNDVFDNIVSSMESLNSQPPALEDGNDQELSQVARRGRKLVRIVKSELTEYLRGLLKPPRQLDFRPVDWIPEGPDAEAYGQLCDAAEGTSLEVLDTDWLMSLAQDHDEDVQLLFQTVVLFLRRLRPVFKDCPLFGVCEHRCLDTACRECGRAGAGNNHKDGDGDHQDEEDIRGTKDGDSDGDTDEDDGSSETSSDEDFSDDDAATEDLEDGENGEDQSDTPLLCNHMYHQGVKLQETSILPYQHYRAKNEATDRFTCYYPSTRSSKELHNLLAEWSARSFEPRGPGYGRDEEASEQQRSLVNAIVDGRADIYDDTFPQSVPE